MTPFRLIGIKLNSEFPGWTHGLILFRTAGFDSDNRVYDLVKLKSENVGNESYKLDFCPAARSINGYCASSINLSEN